MTNKCLSLVVHGGAGAKKSRDYAREIAHMRAVVEAGREALRRGDSALDVVQAATRELELSGLYVAGRGASPNTAGDYELDACLMDGATGRAGAVAALQGFKSPVGIARCVMERTPHVMLAGEGAAAFAREQGLEAIGDPKAWFTRAGTFEDNHPPGRLAHGTVGAVARDAQGRLAAATSTGGVFGKLPGRVGDTPIIGSGGWADGTVAVSCTGQGEYFIRTSAASQVAFRMRFGGQSLAEATAAVLAEIKAMGGDGGLIAIDAEGAIAMPYVSEGMKRAGFSGDGEIVSAAFEA